MVELISRVSRGSRMDQIYIPKNRHGFGIGNYVAIRPLETLERISEIRERPHFYRTSSLEPAKLSMINEIFSVFDKTFGKYDNIIITGSFLDKGFCFKDIDILVISDEKADIVSIKKAIEELTGVKAHIILLDRKTLISGLSIDPLYQLMLSKCVSKKRFVFKTKRKVNYKMLDLHLLKSKALVENFDILDGSEKYHLTRNMIAIYLYLEQKSIDKEKVDAEIKRFFGLRAMDEIKQNMLDKKDFLKKYKNIYSNTFNKIMGGVKHGSK